MPRADAETTHTSTYERLVIAASQCLSTQDPSAVTLDEIARHAGVHRVTLHRTFPGGRDELILAVLHREALALSDEILAAIDKAADCEAGLLEGLTLLYWRASNDGVIAGAVTALGARSALLEPGAAALHALGLDLWRHIRARAAEEGRRTVAGRERDVIDHVTRVGLSLVSEPGTIDSERRMRSYVERFIVPALIYG
jgi:AcrR family transcriptional regulator